MSGLVNNLPSVFEKMPPSFKFYLSNDMQKREDLTKLALLKFKADLDKLHKPLFTDYSC